MEQKTSEIAKAMKVITEALRTDEGYRIGWQANIAMAFQDEFNRTIEQDKSINDKTSSIPIHAISNKAAVYFLSLLCSSGNKFELLKDLA